MIPLAGARDPNERGWVITHAEALLPVAPPYIRRRPALASIVRSGAELPADIGGKAAGLALLDRAERDLHVPAWFCVTTHARRVAASDLDSLDGELGVQILDAWRDQLDGAPVAVRSSAVGEDGIDSAQAGRFRSVLDVRTADELLDAVAIVWASAPDEVEMGVVIQRFVEAEMSGVGATRDLATGAAKVVVSWAAGRGDALVGGEVDAASWWADRDGAAVTGAGAATWTDRDVRRLVLAAAEIERLIGRACEFEWCVSTGRLHVVQARPLALTAGGPGGMTEVWSDEPIHEQLPGVVAPLSFGLVAEQVHACSGTLMRMLGARVDPAHPLLARFNGRAYFCESRWMHAARTAATAGPGHVLLRDALGLGPSDTRFVRRAARLRAQVRLLGLWSLVAVSFAFGAWQIRRLTRRIQRATDVTDLTKALRAARRAMVANDVASALAAHWFGEAVQPRAGANLSGHISMAHRLSEGLKLESGVLGEVLGSAALDQEGSPRRSRTRETTRLAWRQRLARRVVGEREHYGWLRAEAFAYMRAAALDAAERAVARGSLEIRSDVFLLTPDEVRALDGRLPSAEDIAERRHEFARASSLAALPQRWASAEASMSYVDAHDVGALDAATGASGVGCSAGAAVAPIVHITGPADIERSTDAIVICQWLTPDIASMLHRAAGIVVARGSLLSHGVLVARELGIPTIVGVGDAYADLVDGDLLHVDGATGFIQRL